jgi:hypothetical protein
MIAPFRADMQYNIYMICYNFKFIIFLFLFSILQILLTFLISFFILMVFVSLRMCVSYILSPAKVAL